MRWLVVALGIALTATVSIAQPASDPTDASKLEVVKFNWAKERIGWERDPFGGPIENFDETRARQRNERARRAPQREQERDCQDAAGIRVRDLGNLIRHNRDHVGRCDPAEERLNLIDEIRDGEEARN